MSILRKSAKDCPHCMSCFLGNPNGDLLALAHSNELAHGRGAYHKSEDIFGAILCKTCHDAVDGRNGNLPKAVKIDMHAQAHSRTLMWWWNNGYVIAAECSTLRLA